MKKLLLISVLIIFSCSGGDDEVTETFLEKYNGIVWDIDIDGGGAEYPLIAFTNEPQGFIGGLGLATCHEVIFGIPLDITTEAATVTILLTMIENSENRLEYQYTEVGVGNPFEYSVLYEAIDGGNNINVTYRLGDLIRPFNGTRTELLVTSCN